MEKLVQFAAGSILLREGEVGQSLFFIRSGTVEVFKETPQGEVLLTMQNAGEVVGLLTFYSGEKRLATARAHTDVECLVVEKQDNRDLVKGLPKWFQVVVKEFTLRLVQSNNQIAALYDENQRLREQNIDPLFVAIQYIDVFRYLAPLKAKVYDDGKKRVLLDDMLEVAEACLRYPRSRLGQLQTLLKDSGVVKVEIEPDRGRPAFDLANLEKLQWFSDFATSVRSGPKHRLLEIHSKHRQRRQLYALRNYVEKQGRDPGAQYSENLAQLLVKYENLFKLSLEQDSLELAKQLGIIELSRKGESIQLSFQANHMIRTLLCLNAIRRIMKDPECDDENEAIEAGEMAS